MGKVYLIGAGPGAPDLLTLRAAKLLHTADVILHDELVHPDVLRQFPKEGAVVLNTGMKRKPCAQDRQDDIFRLIKKHYAEGDTIARLKCGDPLIFSRGGEECQFLEENEIPFEVVPGISSVTSAPTSAHIPLTHRYLASSFSVFTAHRHHDIEAGNIDWDLAARSPTAVFVMGVKALPKIVEILKEKGRSSETPVAVIEKGCWPEERVTFGTLETILEKAKEAQSPAVIVVGEVVRLGH